MIKKKTWLQVEIETAQKSLKRRSKWTKAVDHFEGINLPSATYGGIAPPPIKKKP